MQAVQSCQCDRWIRCDLTSKTALESPAAPSVARMLAAASATSTSTAFAISVIITGNAMAMQWNTKCQVRERAHVSSCCGNGFRGAAGEKKREMALKDAAVSAETTVRQLE